MYLDKIILLQISNPKFENIQIVTYHTHIEKIISHINII